MYAYVPALGLALAVLCLALTVAVDEFVSS